MQVAAERREDVGERAGERGAFYHPELDVLRLFAFVLVFIGHADYDFFGPGLGSHPFLANMAFAIHGAGFSGVALFFTLSAYLITELLLREQDVTGRVHLKAFYLRRVLRIWPLYFFFLLIVRPLAGLVLPWEHFTVRDYLSFLLLFGNWDCVLYGWPPSVATPLWSISIEEQFYLAWPWLVARARRHIPAIAVGMLVAANVARVVTLASGLRAPTDIWCDTFARLDPFAFGILLAFYGHGREWRLRPKYRIMFVAVAAGLLLYAGRYGDHTDVRALWSYPAEAVACLLALAATLRPMGSWHPGAVGRVLIYGGRISYGLYVYHLIMMKFMLQTRLSFWPSKLAAMALTVVVAVLSYQLLEKGFLRLKRRVTYVASRPLN